MPVSPVSSDPREVVRGITTGAPTDSEQTFSCVIHADWCEHRPTKIELEAHAPNARMCSGYVRVFVEGARDFSKYVYAELVVDAMVSFPPMGTKHHFPDGSERTATDYGDLFLSGPVFGMNTSAFVFQDRKKIDDGAYTQAMWPLRNYASGYIVDKGRVGSRMTIRCGYRENGADTQLASFMLPSTADGHVWFRTIAVGCHWDDIATENDDQNVRCGLEVKFRNEWHFGGAAFSASPDAFTFPFEVPRSVFVDETDKGAPKSADWHRYQGVVFSSLPVVMVPTSQHPVTKVWTMEKSSPIGISGCSLSVTCAADHANVILGHGKEDDDDDSIVPCSHQDQGGSGPVTEEDLPFVRRPDKIARLGNTVAAADSWHATHLVRLGSPLAGRRQLHALEVTFERAPYTPPRSNPRSPGMIYSPKDFPLYSYWQGQAWTYPVRRSNDLFPINNPAPLPNQGPQLYVAPAGDEMAWIVGVRNDDEYAPPDLWFWNAISGRRTLGPRVGERRLFPNNYHFHSPHALNKFNGAIVPPDEDHVEWIGMLGPWMQFSRDGPYTQAQWAHHTSVECPTRPEDYRVSLSVESFAQIWAHTEYEEFGWADRAPLDIPFEDSGMATETYDEYARRNDVLWGGVAPWRTWNPGGVVLTFRARVGLKITLHEVKGFRLRRKAPEPTYPFFDGYGSTFYAYRPAGGLEVWGNHNCSDVAFTEYVQEFRVPLTPSELVSLGSGFEITKQLHAGSGDGPVYRTMQLRVVKTN